MATENIIMAIVKNGGDRQEAHEKIRVRLFFSLTFSPCLSILKLSFDLPKGPIP